MDCDICLLAFSSILYEAHHVSYEDLNLRVNTEIADSPYRLQHGESLVSFTDPGVDFLVTVAGCCHFDAQIGEFFNVL